MKCYTCNIQNVKHVLKREIWSEDLGLQLRLVLNSKRFFSLASQLIAQHQTISLYPLDINSTVELLLIYFGVLPDWCLLPCMDWLLLC